MNNIILAFDPAFRRQSNSGLCIQQPQLPTPPKGLLSEKQRQGVATLNHIALAQNKVRDTQISERVRLAMILQLWAMQRTLNRVQKLGRKRSRKRLAALRHRANGVVNRANQTLTDEINAALG